MTFNPADPNTWPAPPPPPRSAPPPESHEAEDLVVVVGLAASGAYAGWRALGGRGTGAAIGAVVGAVIGWSFGAALAVRHLRLA